MLITALFTVLAIYLIFKTIPQDFRNEIVLWRFVAIAFFLIALISVFRYKYHTERTNQLEDMMEFLEVDFQTLPTKRNSIIGGFIFRLLTYPFSVFLIVFSLYNLFERDNYAAALGAVSISLTYFNC